MNAIKVVGFAPNYNVCVCVCACMYRYVYMYVCMYKFSSFLCRWVIMRDLQRARLYSKRLDRRCKSFQMWLKKSRYQFVVKLYSTCSAWSEKPKGLQCFRIYFFGFSTLYRIAFVIFSLAALVQSAYWYCGCLLYIFLKSKLLAQVLTAISRSGEPFFSKLAFKSICILCIHLTPLYR